MTVPAGFGSGGLWSWDAIFGLVTIVAAVAAFARFAVLTKRSDRVRRQIRQDIDRRLALLADELGQGVREP